MEQNLHDDTCLAPSRLVFKPGKTERRSFPNDAEIIASNLLSWQ
jgi:hypothetical protein